MMKSFGYAGPFARGRGVTPELERAFGDAAAGRVAACDDSRTPDEAIPPAGSIEALYQTTVGPEPQPRRWFPIPPRPEA